MSTSTTISIEALIAEEIARSFVGTDAGHCARVDFFELQQIEGICAALQTLSPDLTLHYLGHRNSGLAITTDRAIELRNRKNGRLCLFVPTDLVDAAFSSLANSFAILDGRELLHVVLQRVRERLSPTVGAIVRDVLGQLRPPLRASESQKIDFCRALLALEEQENLAAAGTELWRVGLIADRGEDFRVRLDRNRQCVIKLAMPLKLQASLTERIAATKVDAATTTRLVDFFRNKAMNDYPAWSQALASSESSPTFEQWTFPQEEQSDLRQVSLQPFVDREGKVKIPSKLKQPDGPGGALIAEYGDDAKGISVRWTTEPQKPRNVGGWRVEIVPVANPDHHELDLPSRDLPPGRTSTTLKIELDFSGEEGVLPDESFQVRLTALDQVGDVLQNPDDGQDLIALSEEFYIAKADEQIAHGVKREIRQRTAPNFALARIEVALETKADLLDEQEPLWASRDLEYFSLRFDERRKMMIGVSRLLKELEEKTLGEPLSLGRYRLRLDEVNEAAMEEVKLLAPPSVSQHWQKFRRLREQLFKQLKGAEPRHLVSVARWDVELARRAAAYARAYNELLEALASDPALREELLAALSIDTLLVVTPKRGGGVEETVITLPTHPLRMLWYASYQQLLAQWESRLFELKLKERPQALDLDRLRQVAPANMPLFVIHPEASAPLLHAANLRFFYGIALPSTQADPQRRLADLAVILGDPYGLEHDGDSSAVQLADHIKRFRSLHPYLRGLNVVQINADRGELLTESLSRVFAQPTSSEDEESELQPLPSLTIQSYIESEQTGTAQDIADLRRLVADQVRFDGQSYLAPALTYTQRPSEVLRGEDPPATHLAIASDMIQPQLTPLEVAGAEALGSSFSLYGLVCRPIPQFAPQGQRLFWKYHLAGDGVRSDLHPVDKSFTETLVNIQIAIARAASPLYGGNAGGRLGLRVELDPYRQQLLEKLHAHSTWVVTIDRYFALDYYDTPHDPHLQSLARKYLIDYNPEFTDGLARRLIVTTTWRDEVEDLLSRAMDELGFAQLESSVGRVLDALKMVSGQLALQVSDLHNNAAAAVGLGVVVMHLQRSGRLRDSILLPVDSAPQIFSRRAPNPIGGERRCDLALFSFKRGVVEVTFIEVKWRRGAVPLESLAGDMVLQMQSSAALVRSLYFPQPDRVDGVLQRARLANVLRFYLERAQRHDVIAPENVAAILDHLGKLERREIEFRPKYEGYIVTPDAIADQALTIQGAKVIVRGIASLADGFVISGSTPAPEASGPLDPSEPVVTANSSASSSSHSQQAVAQPDELAAAAQDSPSSNDLETSPATPAIPQEPGAEQSTQQSSAPAAPSPLEHPTHSMPDVIQVHLGDTDEQPIIWQPSVKGSPHLFIIGIPGQGKSVAISNVLNDLMAQGVAPLILDFHGQFADPQGPLVQHYGLRALDASEGLPFNPFEVMIRNGKLDWRDNSQAVADIFAHVVELGGIQKDGLFQAILDSYKAKGFHPTMTPEDVGDLPTPAEVLSFIEERERQRKVKNLAARCRPLLEMDLFNPNLPPLQLRDELRKGLVIDLHGVLSESVQMAAGSFVLRKVYREMFLWGEAEQIRLVIILDEAHRLAKDQTLPKIMKEGRKYGVAVVAASQGMRDFHPDVLNTAGTKVLFRVNYPESRTLTKYIASPLNKRIDTIVEQLPVGQAFVQTPEMRFGRQVRMRPPTSE